MSLYHKALKTTTNSWTVPVQLYTQWIEMYKRANRVSWTISRKALYQKRKISFCERRWSLFQMGCSWLMGLFSLFSLFSVCASFSCNHSLEQVCPHYQRGYFPQNTPASLSSSWSSWLSSWWLSLSEEILSTCISHQPRLQETVLNFRFNIFRFEKN